MAVKDDLIAAGLSETQAVAVVAEDSTGDNTDGLVAAGFSVVQAQAMHAYNADKTAENLDAIVKQGIWAGTALVAIDAALDVTP